MGLQNVISWIMTNVANCENPNHKWRFMAGKIHYFYGKISIWLFNIAMENGPFIDGLLIKNGDFPWLC